MKQQPVMIFWYGEAAAVEHRIRACAIFEGRDLLCHSSAGFGGVLVHAGICSSEK